MCGWCLACCTGVVLNTVRESATPDCKENKQADAGIRFVRMHFLCDALLCNCSSAAREGLSTRVPRECSANPLCAASVTNRLYAQSPVLKIVHEESVKVYVHIYVQRECSAEPSMNVEPCD